MDASEERQQMLDKARDKIKHVVVVCMENRSYDHMFGAYERVLPDSATISSIDTDLPVATPHSFLGGLVCRAFKKCGGDLSPFGFKVSSVVSDWAAKKCIPPCKYDIL